MAEEIVERNLEDELTESYLIYSMSVIVGRAIPDVRDGLKPVQRRILYGMLELGLKHNSSFKKSARIVGEVMGKYHPHGDAAIYDALVKMAQPFSMRYPLVDGQGNFGSVDRDPPAAMRYTEARLSRIAEEMLEDLDKETVDFVPNFDETLKEPIVLPSKVPNLLINGASGIAVGMATNIPPHNLGEIVDGLIHLIDNPSASVEEIMRFVKGPDFPTGGEIIGKKGLINLYKEGKGSIHIRGKAEIEKTKRGFVIVISEVPYQVSKAGLIEQIANFARNSQKPLIRNIRDESDRKGMRVVVELTKDANPEIVLNQLYKHTSLETSFAGNMLVIDEMRRPRLMNLIDLMKAFIKHRFQVIKRRSEYELKKASKRAHILEGLIKASRSIGTIVQIIRNSKNTEEAMNELKEIMGVTDEQAKAILDMKLGKLTNLEIEKLIHEHEELTRRMEELKDVITSDERTYEIMKKELMDLKEKYADQRRTKISLVEKRDYRIEDLVSDEEIVIMVSHEGYVNTTTLQDYRRQYRGGRGTIGMRTRDEDFVEHVISSSRLSKTMVITSLGKAYVLRNHELVGSRGAKGKHILSYIKAGQDEKVKAIINIGKDFDPEKNIVMVTKFGKIKRISLSEFSNVRSSGVRAMNIPKGDEIVDAVLVKPGNETTIMLSTRKGMCIRFRISDIRIMGRNATGVNAMNLKEGDEIVSMSVVGEKDGAKTLLTITRNGYGKRTRLEEYRIQSRGGMGIKNLSSMNKVGEIVSTAVVDDEDEILVVTENGFTIRFSAKNVRIMGRITQGVKVVDLKSGDKVSSMTVIKE